MVGGASQSELLEEAEREAELIVSAVRISVAVVIMAALVIALSFLDEAPPDTIKRQIHVAAIVMSSYFALGVVALTITIKGSLRPWMPWAFASVDIGLVIGNAWWSMDNSHLPQAYLFTTPAVWAAPVVFAFASLRYRPGLQAYMVVAVVTACAALLWWWDLPGDDPSILPNFFDAPPNVVRTAMLALCGGILVLAAHRRRALLARALREAEERSQLARFLPAQIAPMMADHRRELLLRGWRTDAAVIAIDIRGFTGLSETMTPEDLTAFISAYRTEVIKAADAHRAVVDKFIGDGALVVFGVPQSSGDDAANAIAFGKDLLARIGRWRRDRWPDLRIGIGGHWGEVFAGAVGDASRVEFTVLGDTVNVAARLEELTKSEPAEFIVSKNLMEEAGAARNEWNELDIPALRGRSEPVTAVGWKGAESA